MPQNSPGIAAKESNKSKIPRFILPGIFAFAPNKDTLGATAYLIVDKSQNILIDCPLWHDSHRDFILSQGGVTKLIITHRGSIGKEVKKLQVDLDCEVIIQEQEAYLLPEVKVTSFRDRFISAELELIWTPGHSPGSSCIYWKQQGGILFTGRHLLPKSVTEIAPIHTAKTFHWWRQLNSVAQIRDRFSAENLKYIISGANTGYLRGQGYIDDAYSKLQSLDLDALKKVSN
ncbi:Beta-lactamase-like protein [Hyella patelloides LEGE 07179]|uniref:Beta-lactamase-like protein n=1 Tax=Hyella patelloides LEGE 07179 TaxID=945734 RepID=A0A563W437_9CYAN|nr:MBL fold metallo-hydrolase [Hyella patelloides]VEP18451.1 Beta-lactamase-like protein [Hyella patelloides LEGE 07179]